MLHKQTLNSFPSPHLNRKQKKKLTLDFSKKQIDDLIIIIKKYIYKKKKRKKKAIIFLKEVGIEGLAIDHATTMPLESKQRKTEETQRL
jgi:hypothetical protein